MTACVGNTQLRGCVEKEKKEEQRAVNCIKAIMVIQSEGIIN